MKKTIFSILALLVSMTTMAQYQPSEQVKQSQKEFQDFKFGIFIHWGIYSMLGDGEWVMNNKSINYQEYPTKMGFADFCGKNRSTVWHAVNHFYPEVKKQWQETIEQVLVNGVNAGVYHVTMTIFILKNWCEWTDKRETVTTEKKPAIASKQELRDAIQQYLQAPIEEDSEQTE